MTKKLKINPRHAGRSVRWFVNHGCYYSIGRTNTDIWYVAEGEGMQKGLYYQHHQCSSGVDVWCEELRLSDYRLIREIDEKEMAKGGVND